jgi:two-component system cell cycle response regulator
MKKDKKPEVILIVDDDELVRMTLSVLVSSFGYHCLVAGDGTEAIEVLRATEIDLVFSDIAMPNMDGLELLRYITEYHKETDVIMATGYSDRASYADVIKAGALDFIKKPIDQAELEAKLARAFRERYLVRRLEQLSMIDSLTSLWNRRAFDKRFSEEVERASRQRYQIFLAIIDIDNFKEFNDTYGHQEGDDVLVTLGEIFSECIRNSVDMSFRLGGDEFAVILPQTTADQATEIVQRILLKFVERNLGRMTLSIGVVACERDRNVPIDVDERRMKERADQAMYDAKKSGKNCVICRL